MFRTIEVWITEVALYQVHVLYMYSRKSGRFSLNEEKATSTVFPRISAQALISYRDSKTWRLNQTRRLFEACAYFLLLISKVRWNYDILYLRRIYVVFERFLQETSTHGSDGLHLHCEKISCEAAGLFSSI